MGSATNDAKEPAKKLNLVQKFTIAALIAGAVTAGVKYGPDVWQGVKDFGSEIKHQIPSY